MRRSLPLAAALLLALALAGCADEGPPPPPEPSAPPPSAGVAQSIDEKVSATLGGVELELEVADEPQERATGLMGRTEIPPGTGMVFLFDEQVSSSFYMFQVPVPLTAVFVRDGVVVGIEQMAPCSEPDPAACPLYGPAEPYDTVVETAPATLAGLAVGAKLELER